MLLYDEENTVSLEVYGIQIPVHKSKAARTLEVLRSHPVLGPKAREWQVQTRPMDITRQDLLRAHADGYVDRLFSDQVEQEVLKTYELVDDDGSYHRYDPEKAQRPLADVLLRTLDRLAGTVQCCRIALQTGFCFYLDRDLVIARFLQERSIPQACLMSGGYGPQTWRVYARFLEKMLLERYGSVSSEGMDELE